MNMNHSQSARGTSWVKWMIAVVLAAIVGAVSAIGMVKMDMISVASASGNASLTETSGASPEPVGTVSLHKNEGVIAAVKEVKPAVVVVVNFVNTASGLKKYGEGSGIIFDKQGYIVTNNHVVEGAAKVKVLLPNGKNTDAEIMGTDPYSDLAVLRIPSSEVTGVAVLGDSDKLQVGEPAIAIGSPLGQAFDQTVTVGVISATSRMMPVSDEATGQLLNQQAVLQTDAAINPGNSGGALCNIQGQVIGINSSKIASEGVEGMGFAIPINEAQEIIGQILKTGHVSYPALGISVMDFQQDPSTFDMQASVHSGVIVARVQSPEAKQSGLQKGDIITEMDGAPISNSFTLHSELFKHQIGDTVSLTVYRSDGTKQTARVKLTALADMETAK